MLCHNIPFLRAYASGSTHEPWTSNFMFLGRPFRSPNLSTCNFFLVGTSQALSLFKFEVTSQNEEVNKIEVAVIVGDLLEWVKADILQRLVTCIQDNGRHLLDVIFYT